MLLINIIQYNSRGGYSEKDSISINTYLYEFGSCFSFWNGTRANWRC